MRIRKRRVLILFVVAIPVSLVGYIGYLLVTGNFHPITNGEAYRSGQLSSDLLEKYAREYHIRSILNLRGKNSGRSWYVEEVKEAGKLKIAHYDIALSAGKQPDHEELEEILKVFREAPRPILIHCQSGADRSGLVSAMWKVYVDRKPRAEAELQLSIWYGHLSVGKTRAMDRFFDAWSAGSL